MDIDTDIIPEEHLGARRTLLHWQDGRPRYSDVDLYERLNLVVALNNMAGAINEPGGPHPYEVANVLRYLATLVTDNVRYTELLYAVSDKFPHESRHETALRYLLERETCETDTAADVGENTGPNAHLFVANNECIEAVQFIPDDKGGIAAIRGLTDVQGVLYNEYADTYQLRVSDCVLNIYAGQWVVKSPSHGLYTVPDSLFQLLYTPFRLGDVSRAVPTDADNK